MEIRNFLEIPNFLQVGKERKNLKLELKMEKDLKRIPHKYGLEKESKRISHKYGHMCVRFFLNPFPTFPRYDLKYKDSEKLGQANITEC